MLVRFAVDSDALASVGRATPWEMYTIHQRLIRYWQQFGILVFPGDQISDSSFMQAVRQLPDNCRKLYETALKNRRLRSLPGPVGWLGLSSAESEADLEPIMGQIRVAALDAVRAAYVGLEDREISREILERHLEITRLESLDQTRHFREIEASMQHPVQAGVEVDHLWRSRFKDFAAHARQVVIVDRYAGENLYPGRDRGLLKVLQLVDQAARRATVTVFTGWKQNSAESVLSELQQFRSTRGGVQHRKLYVIPDDVFGGQSPDVVRGGAHDRYLRFDHTVVTLGIGVSVFSGSRVARNCSVGVSELQPSHRTIEEGLRIAATVSSTQAMCADASRDRL